MRPIEAERLDPIAALRAMHGMAQRFMRRQDGTITVFAMAVFVLMVGVGGIAIDLMRFEAQRSQLQSTLDRAVLAAASLNQQRDPEAVVRNYFETAGIQNFRLTVDVERSLNFRRVAVEAEADVQTRFMRLFGQRVLTSFASGAAEERIPRVEVSLVLDISGSMIMNNRIGNLKDAARAFVTSMLQANNNPEGQQLVSISLVPFNMYVNMGSTLNRVYRLTNEHTLSRCARFYPHHYTVSGLNPSTTLQRSGHFNWHTYVPGMIANDGVPCWRGEMAAIMPFSNNHAALHASINQLRANGGTAINQGIRWGLALLDPMARPAMNTLVSQRFIHSHFRNRPADYTDNETLKVMVIMTDGIGGSNMDLFPHMRSGPSPFWRDPDNNNFSVFYPEFNQYWQVANRVWSNVPDGGPNNNAQRLTYGNFWNYFPVHLVRPTLFGDSQAWAHPYGARQTAVNNMGLQFQHHNGRHPLTTSRVVEVYDTTTIHDQQAIQLCNIARANGVHVFTVAFELWPGGEPLMQGCATTDSHFYRASGAQLTDTFLSIANSINQLRLVQ